MRILYPKFSLGQRAGNFSARKVVRSSRHCYVSCGNFISYLTSTSDASRYTVSPVVVPLPLCTGCAHFYLLFRRSGRASFAKRISSSTFRIRILLRLSLLPFSTMWDEYHQVFPVQNTPGSCLITTKHYRGYKISILSFALPSACLSYFALRYLYVSDRMISLENKMSAKKNRETRQESRRILH